MYVAKKRVFVCCEKTCFRMYVAKKDDFVDFGHGSVVRDDIRILVKKVSPRVRYGALHGRSANKH